METPASPATLEQRLATLEREMALQRDQIEIRQLIASYGPRIDTSDRIERTHLIATMWLEDGIYDIGGMARFEGRDAIAHAFEVPHFQQVPHGVCHVMGLPYVRIDGDNAIAFNYSVVMRPDGEERFFPWRVSMNRWELVRQDSKWMIRHRLNRLMTGDAETRAALQEIDVLVASEDR